MYKKIEHHISVTLLCLSLLLSCYVEPVMSNEKSRLILATTTSVANSGLLNYLHAIFQKKYNTQVHVIAVGSGKAIELARNGDVDILMAHSPDEEVRFEQSGNGIDRKLIMYNHFMLAGPEHDPAKIAKASNIKEVMQKIAQSGYPFISRGDNSGTHVKEQMLWEFVKIDPQQQDWYISTGQSMGAVLTIAADKMGYTLTDRGTFLAYKAKTGLTTLYPLSFTSKYTEQKKACSKLPDKHTPDEILFNPYSVTRVNPKKHPHVNVEGALQYQNFLTSKETALLIAQYKINGEVLFHPICHE